MLNRSQPREKNVLDEMELVENGQTYSKNGTKREDLKSVAIGNPDKPDLATSNGTAGTLSLRDQKALALLVALCKLPPLSISDFHSFRAFRSLRFYLPAP